VKLGQSPRAAADDSVRYIQHTLRTNASSIVNASGSTANNREMYSSFELSPRTTGASAPSTRADQLAGGYIRKSNDQVRVDSDKQEMAAQVELLKIQVDKLERGEEPPVHVAAGLPPRHPPPAPSRDLSSSSAASTPGRNQEQSSPSRLGLKP
jgi:hypothetical protein